MFLDLIITSLIAIPFVILFQIVGRIIGPSFGISIEDSWKNNFIELVIGLFVVISVYSVLIMHGLTIYIFPLFYFIFFIIKKRKIRIFKLLSRKLFFIPFFLFLINFISIINDVITNIDFDILFYNFLSENLSTYKLENTYGAYNSDILNEELIPYHYLEIYIGNIIYELIPNDFYLSNALLFKFSGYTLLKLICIYGWFAVLEFLNLKRKFSWFLGSLGPLLLFTHFNNLFMWDWPIEYSFWKRPNFLSYYIGGVMCFLGFVRDEKFLKEISILFLFISSIIVVPALSLGLTIYSFFDFFILRNKKSFNSLFKIILLCLFIGLFYFTFSSKNTNEIVNFSEVVNNIISGYKAIIGYFLRLIGLISILFFIETLIMKFFRIDENHKKSNILFNFFILSICITLSGSIFFQFFNSIDNMYQLPYVGYVFLYMVLIASIIYFLDRSEILHQKILIYVIFFYSFFDFLIQIKLPVNSNSLVEYQWQKRGLDNSEISSLDSFFNKYNCQNKIYYEWTKSELSKLSTGMRHALTYPKGLELSYIKTGLSFYPNNSKEEYYTFSNANDIHFKKINKFNSKLSVYRDMDKRIYINNLDTSFNSIFLRDSLLGFRKGKLIKSSPFTSKFCFHNSK